MLWITSVVPD
jgi:MFS family permease